MKTESFIRLLAGTFILISLGLAQVVSPWWQLFTGFIGLNLIQSTFTGFCPPTWLLGRLGLIRADGTLGRPRSMPQR
mgnify:CR=1 FL=1